MKNGNTKKLGREIYFVKNVIQVFNFINTYNFLGDDELHIPFI